MNYKETEKDLPHNIEAEQVVIGSALLEPTSVMPLLAEKLHPDQFYDARNRACFAALIDMFESGTPSDIVLLANRLEELGQMEAAGGRMYLSGLLDRTTTTASLGHYIKIVRNKYALRQLVTAGEHIRDIGYNEISDVTDVISEATRLIGDVEIPEDRPPYIKMSDEIMNQLLVLEEIHSRGESVIGVPSGFDDLDKYTSGFRKSDLIVLAARPGVGKSAMITSITRRISQHGHKVGIFSLEMSSEQIMQRILSGEGRINLQRMRGGFMNTEEWRRLTDAASRIIKVPVVIDDSPGNTLVDILAKARMMKERENIEILFIDYLQLMEISGFSRNRENEVAQITRSLKKLARELEIPIVALSQLNRNTEGRSGTSKRPTLADLRESGAIEQDADIVMFIYRDDYYNTETGEMDIVVPAELIIAKQRNGPLGRIHISFHKSFVDFYPNVYSDDVDFRQN